jgi:hypothetical protein
LASHVAEVVHSVWGRVSTTQAPWLQYSPLGQEPALHDAVHEPSTQYGVGAEQLALVVQAVAEGRHAPAVQVIPAPQAVAGQPTTHWPLAQTFPVPQSLVYVQVSTGGVQTLPAQTLPPVQSVFEAQGQGPFVPPQVTHSFCQHSWDAPVHWLLVVQAHAGWFAPPQGVHWLATQVLPAAQSLGLAQVFASAASAASAEASAAASPTSAPASDAASATTVSGAASSTTAASIPTDASNGTVGPPTGSQPYPSHW